MTPRRWCIPPAMLRDPADGLEGDSVLSESPGDFGLLLWGTVRDVRLWAETSSNLRGNLFGRGKAETRCALLAATRVPQQVSASIDTLHGMLSLSSRADADIVTICCLEVAAWARAAGLPHTAIAFAQAAALASPNCAEPAVHVGVHARAAGQDARAETWLRRAVSLARRERDWAAYCAAYVELGMIYETRSSFARADRLFQAAFRAGRRYSVQVARMQGAHGRFRLALLRGDIASAAHFARLAQNAFEAGAPGGVDLLLHLARFWTDTGNREFAGGALRHLAKEKGLPPARLLAVRALTARARAEVGNRQKGAADTRAAWVLMSDGEIPDDVKCAAAVDLAHAAAKAGHLARFKRARLAVLRFSPQECFPAAATEIAEIWPHGAEPASTERAS